MVIVAVGGVINGDAVIMLLLLLSLAAFSILMRLILSWSRYAMSVLATHIRIIQLKDYDEDGREK